MEEKNKSLVLAKHKIQKTKSKHQHYLVDRVNGKFVSKNPEVAKMTKKKEEKLWFPSYSIISVDYP